MQSSGNKQSKTECLNPNTGRKMNIPSEIYSTFHDAIQQALRNGQELTYTEIVEYIQDYLRKRKLILRIQWNGMRLP